MKAVNRYTSNEFHDWQFARLTRDFVIQDLDAWALAIGDPADNYRPVALIELKRSTIPPDKWRPFADDRRNYASLLALANAAGIPLFVVYFEKGKPIEDDSIFHVFRMTEADPEFHGTRRLMRADDFAKRFPIVLDDPALAA